MLARGLILALSILLFGCGNKFERVAKAEAEGEQRLNQEHLDELRLAAFGIDVEPRASVQADANISASYEQLRVWHSDSDLHLRLRDYIKNIHAMLKLARFHGMHMDAETRDRLERSAAIARHYIDLLKD